MLTVLPFPRRYQPSRPTLLRTAQLRGSTIAVVPLAAIVVYVTRPGGRANELLAAVAKQLGRGPPTPDERGHVRILLEESAGAAWQRVNDALDAAGDDWDEHLHVNPRPE
jgi:hypothetical protein